MTDHYAVVGNPVAHSVSPLIHAQFALQTGEDIDYVKLLAPLDGFAECVAQFRASGGKGVNVTLPFKIEAYRLATRLNPAAQQAQAVNTLKFEGNDIIGDNTDGRGLTRDLEVNLGFAIAGRRVLLMGAGGAAQGVLAPLFAQKPAVLMIANRTLARAQTLADSFERSGCCAAASYEALAGSQFDLVINATSASVAGALPPLPPRLYASGALAYDMMYAAEPTLFLRSALACGAARIADGIGMLVEQAAVSFQVWRGVCPDTKPVLEKLKGERPDWRNAGQP